MISQIVKNKLKHVFWTYEDFSKIHIFTWKIELFSLAAKCNMKIAESFPHYELSIKNRTLYALFNKYSQENLIILNCSVIKNKL